MARKKLNPAYLLAGILFGVLVLSIQFYIPYTPVVTSIFELDTPEGPKGTRAQIFGVRLHHYQYGLAIIGLATLLWFRGPRQFRNLYLIMYGFGALLFVDQIDNIWKEITGDPTAWGSTARLSAVQSILPK